MHVSDVSRSIPTIPSAHVATVFYLVEDKRICLDYNYQLPRMSVKQYWGHEKKEAISPSVTPRESV